MPKTAEKVKRVTVYLLEKDIERLHEEAKKDGTSLSVITRRAVRKYIDSLDEEK